MTLRLGKEVSWGEEKKRRRPGGRGKIVIWGCQYHCCWGTKWGKNQGAWCVQGRGWSLSERRSGNTNLWPVSEYTMIRRCCKKCWLNKSNNYYLSMSSSFKIEHHCRITFCVLSWEGSGSSPSLGLLRLPVWLSALAKNDQLHLPASLLATDLMRLKRGSRLFSWETFPLSYW